GRDPSRLPVPEHHDPRWRVANHRLSRRAHGAPGLRRRLASLGSIPSTRRRGARAAGRLLPRRDEGARAALVGRKDVPAESRRLPSPAAHAGARRLRLSLGGQGEAILPQARARGAPAAQAGRRRGAAGVSGARPIDGAAVITWGASTGPPNPPALAAPQRSRGAPRIRFAYPGPGRPPASDGRPIGDQVTVLAVQHDLALLVPERHP